MNTMRVKIYILAGIACMLMLPAGCVHSGSEIAKIVEERDSLKVAADKQARRLENLDTLIKTINLGLDTIAQGEAGIFVTGVTEGPNAKEAIFANINRLSQVIERQKQELDKYERNLMAQSDDGSERDEGLIALVNNYKRQLAEKDRQIAALKQELSQKNADISQLNNRLGLQTKTIAELDRRNSAQMEALKRQDQMLNYCYMTIGTKKELENKGVIRKGKVVAQSSLDRTKFSRVDIRKFTEIQFSAKRPRILTAMPETAYDLTTDGNGSYTLKIKNPNAFWKMSNYLIIQTQ